MTAPAPDPFRLPPATSGRFVLLITSTLASAAYIYAWLADHIDVVSADPATCTGIVQQQAAAVPASRLTDWYDDCLRQADIRLGLVVAAMLGVLAALTVVLYLAVPAVIAKSLRPMAEATRYAGTRETAERLIATAARFGRVELFVATDGGVSGGRAFGRFGRHRVAIGAGEFLTGGADAALAHELAHIRNRDVDMTYLAIAVWWAFLAAVAVPLTLVAIRAPGDLKGFAWRIAVLLLLLWLIRSSVLRSRELYADVRATRTLISAEELKAALGKRAGAAAHAPVRRWWTYRNHPSEKERYEAVDGGPRLFRLEPAVAGAIGLMIGFGFTPAIYLLRLFVPDLFQPSVWLVGLLFGGIAASVLSGVIWRSTLYRLAGGPRVRQWPTVFALAGGVVVGQIVTPQVPTVGAWPTVFAADPVVAAGASVILLLACHVYVKWTSLCATAWLSAAERPRLAYRTGVAQSGLIVGLWLGYWYAILELAADVPTIDGLAVPLFAILLNPVLLLSVLWACAYPLVADGARGLRAAGLAAVAVLLAYAVVPIPLHGDLLDAMWFADAHWAEPATALAPLVFLLVAPAAGLAAAGAFVAGVIEGGRGRGAHAVAVGGVMQVIVGIGLFPLMAAHLSQAVGDLTLVTTATGAFSADGAGGTWLLLCGGSLLVGLPAALLGSLVRAAFPPSAPRPAPVRRRRRVVWRLAPFVLAAALLAGFGFQSWVLAALGLSNPVQRPDLLATHLAAVAPGTVSRERACAALGEVDSAVSVNSAVNEDFLFAQAKAVAVAQSSTDPSLRKLADSTAAALLLSQTTRANRGLWLMGMYCVSAPG
jgi:Zn-dependent protease with chaperone function